MDRDSKFGAFVRRWQIPLIVGGVLAIGAALTLGYFLWFHQTYGVLFKDLRTMDAATIVADLDKRKVPYELRDGGSTIMVPQKLVDATRLSVMSQELPLKGVVGFELFSKSDMGLTEFAQQINYRRALQGEIARTIMALDDVESARVHLSIGEPTVFRGDRQPSKASVSLIARKGRPLMPASVRGVQRLVAAAVPDLNADEVVVLDGAGAVISDSAAPEQPVDAATPRAAIQAYYAARVRLALRGLISDRAEAVTVTANSLPASGAPSPDAYAAWTPSERRFGLSIQIGAGRRLDRETHDRIAALAAEAIGVRGDLGDSIIVVEAAPEPTPVAAELLQGAVPAAAAPPAPTSTVARARPGISAPSAFWLTACIPALILLIAAAYLLQRRSRSQRVLTVRERELFAQRLRRALEGDADAIARG